MTAPRLPSLDVSRKVTALGDEPFKKLQSRLWDEGEYSAEDIAETFLPVEGLKALIIGHQELLRFQRQIGRLTNAQGLIKLAHHIGECLPATAAHPLENVPTLPASINPTTQPKEKVLAIVPPLDELLKERQTVKHALLDFYRVTDYDGWLNDEQVVQVTIARGRGRRAKLIESAHQLIELSASQEGNGVSGLFPPTADLTKVVIEAKR